MILSVSGALSPGEIFSSIVPERSFGCCGTRKRNITPCNPILCGEFFTPGVDPGG